LTPTTKLLVSWRISSRVMTAMTPGAALALPTSMATSSAWAWDDLRIAA